MVWKCIEKKAQEAMNSIPHFDNVVDLDEDEEVEMPTEVQSKGKRPMSSSGSTANASSKNTKDPLHSVFKPSTTLGKKNGNLVGSVQYNEVQKKLRLDAVQKFCRWMYDAGIPFNALK
ncbi:hypothetical protein L1987_86014 [Smallanthus sonchifolius]|uniref:Uncharacterized protein n=1 Tax=Smallanthus sonchifolius TaxID=185202 RepID=A0ACB8XY59_9ASTR|nr:hypothetical protein L1987_86014 [Smallanthus sonchifolius]